MSRGLLMVATLISVATVTLWFATGRHAYTKFSIVEKAEIAIDANDPLAGTGFYDDDTAETTVQRDTFRLGLLPTPQGLLDKHMLSVASVFGVTWGITLLLVWRGSRPRRATA